jgi:uncharacterized membrane protein
MPWTVSDVIEETFRAFGRNWVTLVVGNLIAGAIALAPVMLWAAVVVPPLLARTGQPDPSTLKVALGSMALAGVSSLVLWILFSPALSRIAIAAARGERPRIADVFDFQRAGSYLGTGLLVGVYACIGTLLFIVPGIIVAIGLSLAAFFVVDGPHNVGTLGAIEASWTATRGHRLPMFGLACLAGVINWILQTVFGLSVWLMPLQIALMLVATPLWTLSLAIIYLRLRPQPRGAVSALAA